MKDEKRRDIFRSMQDDVNNSDMSEEEKRKFMKNFLKMKEEKINIMITGATGCGKSSTINALFGTEKAKVGVGVDPETMEIEKYELDNLVLWDSPGLGDGKEADNRHAKNITKKLLEKDENGDLLIDLVLVILDGSSRDLGTSYELINEVIVPNLGEDKSNRILVAINKADQAMDAHYYWDYEENKPKPKLQAFLDEKAKSVQRRIKEGTGVDVEPIYYSAGYKSDEVEPKPYNLSKLMYYIVKFTPKQKRLSIVNNINQDTQMWKDNDDLKDYRKGILEQFAETIEDCAFDGSLIGESILGGIGEKILGDVGEAVFGKVGEVVGGVIGGVVGVIGGILRGIGGLFGL